MITKLENSSDFIETFITFNKGASWNRIRAPDVDSDGKSYGCEDYCFLNLYGISSDIPPYYSVDSAIGVIVSNGSVGQYLNKSLK